MQILYKKFHIRRLEKEHNQPYNMDKSLDSCSSHEVNSIKTLNQFEPPTKD